jgi:hypothetical protein
MTDEVLVNQPVVAAPEPSGNPFEKLTVNSTGSNGLMVTDALDLALVVQSAGQAEKYIQAKQWALLWRDADLLYQSPRPMTVYENTYIIEPNVQRFTVAKVCNAIIPQLYKGLFYDDPPMLMRPRPGTSQVVIDAKQNLFSFILEDSQFKTQTKWGLEQMALLGTGIWKWGYDWKEIITFKRKAAQLQLSGGDPSGQEVTASIPTDEPPKIVRDAKTLPMPTFEWRPIDKVLVDPHLQVSDIRKASWAIDVRYWDWYQFNDMRTAIETAKKNGEKGSAIDGWNFFTEASIKALWDKPIASVSTAVDQATYVKGVVHHSEDVNVATSPDPLRTKLEVLEYWDKGRKILVLDRKYVIFTGENEFKKIPFLSSNWWNRPKAFYGMGLGLIVGQNQRVDQGTINAILKILSFGVNPIYLRNREDNAPTQMLRTGLGKIMSVTDVEKSYRLLEQPKIDGNLWQALSESEKATESASGADQMLVQGSSAGPRTSMGRTSGGANILAGASATRLDGPLDNFIEQVFKPFLGIIDMLVFNVMSDAAILHILGKEMGQAVLQKLNLEEFHNAQIEYEVLAGASLAAKRTMAQSMVMLTQILDNPQIQQSLADINEEYIDFKPIIKMWLEASEWKNGNDIIKPMTQAMKDKRNANSKAAQMQAQMQMKQQSEQQKFTQKQILEDQASDNRIKRDITREAAKASGMSQTVEGVPSQAGLQGTLPTVA